MSKKITGARAINKSSAIGIDDKWRVEGDLSTLVQAAEIRSDPKRFKACQELAAEKADEMTKIRLGGDSDTDD